MSSTLTTIDPATGEKITDHPAHDAAGVEAAITATHMAAAAWAATPLDGRRDRLSALAKALRADRDEYAALITREMGKPRTEAAAEIEKCAVTAEYYASEAARILADQPVDVDGVRAWIGHEPIGVVYAVMPWNFPFWQVMRCAIPALVAGNTILLKHSPNVTGSALAIEQVLARAGFPPNVITTLVIPEPEVPEVSERIIADRRVAAVTLTGSNRAGAAVGAAAGRAMKKSVLELGGSDPFVVLDDADVDAASTAAVRARFTNAGQSCVCGKRFLVAAPVAEEFIGLFVEKTEALVVGDPTDPATQIGPMARADLRDQLHVQVEQSIAQGARLLAGGRPVDGPGGFYTPTVLVDTAPGITVFDQETFGPVAAVAVGRDDEELAALANASAYGLALSVWSADTERALALAGRIGSGAAFVNAVVASDPRVPFGGIKQSGYGRELSAVGLLEFTNTRTYWVAPA